jgi:UDP-glucose 4-epimerase
MVVPRFVRWALQDEPIHVYGDGEQSRCFSDVQDVSSAVARLAEHPQAVGQVFNIGSQEEVTIRELAERVIQHTGSSSKVQLLPYDQAYAPGFEDMRRRVPSVKKLHGLIGYEPQFGLDESLMRVINWERQHPELEKSGG